MSFNVENIRKDFPFLSNSKNKIIYFDNASTTHKPKIVLEAINNYYSNFNANVHRAAYQIAEEATLEYEKSEQVPIGQFP